MISLGTFLVDSTCDDARQVRFEMPMPASSICPQVAVAVTGWYTAGELRAIFRAANLYELADLMIADAVIRIRNN